MRIYGLDGCKTGWVAASAVEGDLSTASVEIVAWAEDLFRSPLNPVLVAIDIPIGLPAIARAGGRRAEVEVRRRLQGRKSSVFSTPCRAAIFAKTYLEACALSRGNSDPQRALSQQSYNIRLKIAEIDELLRRRPELRPLVREIHPEASFWALNEWRPMAFSKKTKAGAAERRDVLRRVGLPEDAIVTRLKGAAADDVIDALAALVSAQRVRRGVARVFPEQPEVDDYGIVCSISA